MPHGRAIRHGAISRIMRHGAMSRIMRQGITAREEWQAGIIREQERIGPLPSERRIISKTMIFQHICCLPVVKCHPRTTIKLKKQGQGKGKQQQPKASETTQIGPTCKKNQKSRAPSLAQPGLLGPGPWWGSLEVLPLPTHYLDLRLEAGGVCGRMRRTDPMARLV